MFERDVQSMKASFYIESPFRPAFNPGDQVIAGVPLAGAPMLLGHNLVTPKRSAVVPMHVGGTGDTLLAYWQYGMGRAFAFTSDDRPHWAVHWLAWPGYPRFWAQVVRWSLKGERSGELQTTVETVNGRGHVVVDALSPAGDYIDGAHLSAAVAGPDGRTYAVNLPQTAPGRYEATFDTTQTGLYLLNVRDLDHPGIGQTVGLATPYSPEYRNIPPNTSLLSDLAKSTGGRFLAPPGDVFRNTTFWSLGVLDLAPQCVLMAVLILILDIAWRRMGWKIALPSRLRGAEQELAALPEEETIVRKTSFGVIMIPKVRETTEKRPGLNPDPYLTRSASTRIGDDDDPFPYVASKDKSRR
jgi:hypothetical protein